MDTKNIFIIGAGVAGLAAGVYARRAGFNVTILEKHIIPGGLSTSWSRKGYLFEGGMHWLTGSSEKMPLNRIWKEVGALKENNPIFYKDPIYTLVNGDTCVHLYRAVDKLKAELLRVAPEDKKAIRRLCSDIKKFQAVHFVVQDIPGLKAERPMRPSLKELISMAPAVTRLSALTKQSYTDYTAQFKNANVRALLNAVIGSRYNALSFIYTLASFSSGDCGYPEGGSLRMAKNMAETFEALGGTIEYRQNVEKVVIEGGKVRGVLVNGSLRTCDAVIVTQDTRQAIDTLFEKPLEESWTQNMRKSIISEQNMFVALGVKADLKQYPRSMIFPLEEPFEAGGLTFQHLGINNYASYTDKHSPDGCTALTCLLLGDSYHFWKDAKADGTYKQKKEELAERFITRLEQFIPELKGNVEVYDVATPLTYERYCSTFEGSWMSVSKPGAFIFSFPSKSEKTDGLYFAGQRTMMPGGLPITVNSGRKAVQYLCKDNGVIFK